MGGSNLAGTIVYNETWVYDTVANTWTQLNPSGIARLFASSGVINSKLYVVAGRDLTGPTNGMMIYDPTANTWSGGPPIPEDISRCASAVIGSVLYLVAGEGWSSGLRTVVQAYNSSTETWSYKAPVTAAGRRRAGAALNGRVYVCGSSYVTPNADVYEYGA